MSIGTGFTEKQGRRFAGRGELLKREREGTSEIDRQKVFQKKYLRKSVSEKVFQKKCFRNSVS